MNIFPEYLALLKGGILSVIQRAIFISLVSLLIGLFLPWIAAKHNRVLTDDDVQVRMKELGTFQEQLCIFQKYKSQNDSLNNVIKKIDRFIYLTNPEFTESNLVSILKVRELLKNEVSTRKAPIKISGFYNSGTVLLWPIVLTCLSWILFLLTPAVSGYNKLNKEFVLTLITIYSFYRGPVIVRNFFIEDVGRVFYGHANSDVDLLGFVVQESLGLLVALLLTNIWYRWSIIIRKEKEEPVDHTSISNYKIFEEKNIKTMSFIFFHWQLCSLILIGAFIGYSYLYWNLVFVINDSRYMFSAIIIHFLWFISWTFISLPLLISWYEWQSMKSQAITSIITKSRVKDIDVNALVAAINDLQPISFWNLTISSFGVLISFLLPLVQVFIK